MVFYLYPVNGDGARLGIYRIEQQCRRVFRQEIHTVGRRNAVGIQRVYTVYLFSGDFQSRIRSDQTRTFLQANKVGILREDKGKGSVLSGICSFIIEEEVGIVSHQGKTGLAVVYRLWFMYRTVSGYSSPRDDQCGERNPYITGIIGEPYKKERYAGKQIQRK